MGTAPCLLRPAQAADRSVRAGAAQGRPGAPQINVRVGTQVLAEGLRRFGSLQTALQYYGGALSDPHARYANKVLAMKRRLVTAAGRGLPTATDA